MSHVRARTDGHAWSIGARTGPEAGEQMQLAGPEVTHGTSSGFGALSDVVLAVNQAEDLQAAMREVLRATLRAMDFASGAVYVVAGI